MNNVQLCLVVGAPVVFNALMFMVLVVTGTPWMKSLASRMSAIESRTTALQSAANMRCDLILERLLDLDARLTRLAERSRRP
jgi:hypothetical protein